MMSNFGAPVREFQFYLITDQHNQSESDLLNWQDEFSRAGAEFYYHSLSLQKDILYIRVIEKARTASQAVSASMREVDKVKGLRVFWVADNAKELEEITTKLASKNEDGIDTGIRIPNITKQNECADLMDGLLAGGVSLSDALKQFEESGCVLKAEASA